MDLYPMMQEVEVERLEVGLKIGERHGEFYG